MPLKGFKHSAASKAQMSATRKGTKRAPFSNQWRANMSKGMIGCKRPRVTEIGCKECGTIDTEKLIKDCRNTTGYAQMCKACDARLRSRQLKDKMFRYSYGISLLQVEELYEKQNQMCDLCKLPVEFPKQHKSHLDHCHRTKKIRGIVHHKCNLLLGLADENIEILKAAIRYLEEWNAKHNGS